VESHQPVAEKPAQHQQPPPRQAEANRPAEKAAKPKPPPPAAKEKPAEKDKTPDGEKP
jgi:hypothetical protein